ncbi:MAG TPA: 5'-3' exonuclease H3TH domain-containing protein [Acidimicrobiales bacterium]|nr:5'-3' exonuclease H3TH domain-containing protein [Acidimicrobiales bacterium]
MRVHLVDGTYELFRHWFALPSHVTADGLEVAATRGVLGSLLGLLGDATHVGVATDHVIESWRNAAWPGYKDGAGVDPRLSGQFGLLEDAVAALGVTVWPMVDWEADDALASAAAVAAADPAVAQVLVCTPDKDLAQCVQGTRVVQLDRRKRVVTDAAGVRAKFGVDPPSIPDYLALVGDSADGYPGLPGWGAKSAAAVLSRYGHLEAVPALGHHWDVDVRSARTLAATLDASRELALQFRDLATLRTEPPVLADVEHLRWRGPTTELAAMCARIDAPDLVARADRLAAGR